MANKKQRDDEFKRLYGNISKESNKKDSNAFAGYSKSAVNEVKKGEYGKLPRLSNNSNVSNTNMAEPQTTTSKQSRVTQANKEALANMTPWYSSNVPSLKPSTKYSNQNATVTEKPKSNRDTSFDADFDDFYEWRFNKADVMPDYDPLTDTNVPHYEKVKKDIMAKNNWSDAEFENRWKEYNDERNQKMADEEVNKALDVAEKNAVAGTLLQAAYTPQTWVEGVSTGIQGIANTIAPNSQFAKKHTATSSTDPLLTATRLKEGTKQTVKDEHIDTGFGKAAYDMGTGLGDMLMSSAIPTVGPAFSGLASGASNQMHALERGATPQRAAQTGAATGTVSAAMNAVGFDKAFDAVGKTAIGGMGKAALTEAVENIVEDATNLGIDAAINKNESQIGAMYDYYKSTGMTDEESAKQTASDIVRDLAVSGATGAAFGGIMNGFRNADAVAGEIAQKVLYNKANKALSNIESGKVPTVKANSETTDVETTPVSEPTVPTNDVPVETETIAPETTSAPVEDMPIPGKAYSPEELANWNGEADADAQARIKKIDNTVRYNNRQIKSLREMLIGASDDTTKANIQKQIDDLEQNNKDIKAERTDLRKQIKERAKNVPEVKTETPVEETPEIATENPITNAEPSVPRVAPTEAETVSNIPTVQGETNTNNIHESTIPYPETPQSEAEAGKSRVVTNTGVNSGLFTKEELDADEELQKISTYTKHSNQQTYDNARANVEQNGENLLREYSDGTRVIDNDQSVDESMILLTALKKKIENAKTPEDVAKYTAQRNALLSQLRKAGTKGGQEIQAFAKWNLTADGAMINGERILNDRVNSWKSKNKSKVKENSRIANALKNLGYDRTMDAKKVEPSFDEIKASVEKTLGKESVSVNEQFGKEDIEYLAGMLENGASVKELEDALNKKFATGTFGISNETQTKVNELFEYARNYGDDSKEAVEARLAAYKLIADETVGNAAAYEKFEAWRYLAMLGNPKTMIRNFVGNITTNVITGFSNNISAALEGGTDWISKRFGGDGITRQKAILNPVKDSGLIRAARNDADASRYSEVSGTKYEKSVQDTIKRQKSVFNSKFAQIYEALTDKGISDYRFVKEKYGTSLAGYMKANGLDESAFDAENKYKELYTKSKTSTLTASEKAEMDNLKTIMDKVEKGRDYALKQAEYATFHEDNVVADGLSKYSQKMNNSDSAIGRAVGKLIEGTIPFKRTPANVLRTGFDYSPLSAIKSIADTGRLVFENTGHRKADFGDTYTSKGLTGRTKEVERINLSDVFDDWSKTLTGTGLMMLGAYLFDKGILNSSTDKEKYQDDLEGKQNYSITINGKTYTIDWLAPGSMPLLAGAAFKRVWDSAGGDTKKFFTNIDGLLAGANEVFNPLVETSMLQGIQDTLETAANEIRYKNDGAGGNILGAITANALTGYASQSVPTVFGQLARTIDPLRRTSDTVSDSAFLSGMEKQGRKMMNKIPGLSFFNTPYRDAYGETQNNSPFNNWIPNLLYQMGSPAYVQDINVRDADQSARNAFNALAPNPDGTLSPIQDEGVFPAWKSKLTVNGEKIDPKRLEQYREISGNANLEIRNELANDEWFNSLDGQTQTDILKNVNSLIDKIGKNYIGYPQKGNEIDAYMNGGTQGYIDYLKNKNYADQLGISTSTYIEKEAEYKGGAEQYKINSDNAKALGMSIDNYDDKEANYPGGAAQYKKDQVEARNMGFVKKNGDVNMEAYEKALDAAGGNKTLLREATSMQLGNLATIGYLDAKKRVPSLAPTEYKGYYNQMTIKDDGVSQDEFAAYLNKNNASAQEANYLYELFRGDWKTTPHISKKTGKWIF